jgi:hypothetical protein
MTGAVGQIPVTRELARDGVAARRQPGVTRFLPVELIHLRQVAAHPWPIRLGCGGMLGSDEGIHAEHRDTIFLRQKEGNMTTMRDVSLGVGDERFCAFGR